MQQRRADLDLMRIIAITLVLMNHLPAYHLYETETGVSEVGALALAVLTRVNVPLFAMISGALLLGREESYERMWKHRISRLLWVILIFSGGFYLMLWAVNGDVLNGNDFIHGLMAGTLPHMDSYWFLYAYLGFLLLLPLLRHIARAMTWGDFWLLMVLHAIVLTALPLINFTLGFIGEEPLALSHSLALQLATSTLLFYPLTGYWVEHHIDVTRISKRMWIRLAAGSVLGTVLSMLVTWGEGQTSDFSQSYLNLFNYITVITFYLAIKRWLQGTECHLITGVAPLVFGIYLLDNYFKLVAYEPIKDITCGPLGYFGFSICMCLCSFVCCGIVTYLLKLIPGIKKLL